MLETDILEEATGIDAAKSIPADMHGYLLEYVNENFCSSSLSLTSVADHMGSSIYAISRTFKELTGVGFREYITGKRLQHACRLLETTDKTILEIATACGFENATYFTTVFRREYGIPPSRYRTVARHTARELTIDN